MVSNHYPNAPKNEQVIFCGPPPTRAGKKRLTKWRRIANTVKTRPGEWAYLGEQHSAAAWKINNEARRLYNQADHLERKARR